MPNEKPGMFGIPADGPSGPVMPQGQPEAPAPATDPGQPAAPAPEANKPSTPAPETQGQPAQPTTAPAQPAPKEGESPEGGKPEDRSAAYNKHYQTVHQEMMQYLGERYPKIRDEVSDFLHSPTEAQRTPSTTAQPSSTPQTVTPNQQPPDDVPDPLEDPRGYAAYVAKVTAEANLKAWQDAQAQTQKTARQKAFEKALEDESVDIQRQAAKLNPTVPEEVRLEALQRAKDNYLIDLNTPGGPTTLFRVYVNEVHNLMSQQHMNNWRTDTAAELARQQQQVNNMAQPLPAGSVAPGEKSPAQKHLEAMQGLQMGTLADINKQQVS